MAGKVGGGGAGRGMQPNAEPNVIPFIDIMLVMLIIFMVAAPPPTVDIKVDLPPPGNVVFVKPEDAPTVVALADLGGVLEIRIGDQVVTDDQFENQLMFIASNNNPTYRVSLAQLFTEAKIFVDADRETSYYNVIDLINRIDTVGFKKVSLLVKEEAT